MSDHVRKQIRDAVVRMLMDLPTTEKRVYSGRTRPLEKDHQPTWLVYAVSERSGGTDSTMGRPRLIVRLLTLSAQGRVIMADVPDDVLDLMAAEAEAAIGADLSLGGLAKDTTLVATRIVLQSPGERQAGEVTLDFEIQYMTRQDVPTAHA